MVGELKAKTSAADANAADAKANTFSYFDTLVKRGQAGVEFMAIVAFLALLLTIIYIITNTQQSEAVSETSISSGWAVCQQIASEVSTAVSVGDGYERIFFLPQDVNGDAYSVSIYASEQAVSVSWSSYSCRSPLITSQISGSTPCAGSNKVTNHNGVISFSCLS